MRTQLHSIRSDSLGRYYTNAVVSQALVADLPSNSPSTVLDLGCGTGSLSFAASRRWANTNIVTVDLDCTIAQVLQEKLRESGFVGGHYHMMYDALSPELATSLRREKAQPEIAVCNPPFLVPKWKRGYSAILEDVGLSSCLPAIATVDAALVFLAQNLRLLQPGGILGIIVPDSIVSADKYKNFRIELLNRYRIRSAVRLSRGSFGGTDALAHILVIENSASNGAAIALSSLNEFGVKTSSLLVEHSKAAHRLDYQFHFAEANARQQGMRLGDIAVDLRRGSLHSAQAKDVSHFVLHTTNLNSHNRGQWLDFSGKSFRFPLAKSGPVTRAEAGDIVVARVGRTAHDKVIGIGAGSVVLTDCLYRLRVSPSKQDAVLQALSSSEGRAWLELHAYGVAARQLTKSDLLNLPLRIL
ncbi:N-6 DNA methylase [Herbaspirillum sp. C7C2]|uniref:N-6 DNA methylase n=1 Tax=Herbaspirillum sp. C7C2 TaxID=2736666 RepID=UPI001F524DC8|nr:N-6 DNA methylase [Herbaspirillum sp. C7C2]MCI1012806.1 N-6 DNA methylase [Herbaspirillum sp. C7C2]